MFFSLNFSQVVNQDLHQQQLEWRPPKEAFLTGRFACSQKTLLELCLA